VDFRVQNILHIMMDGDKSFTFSTESIFFINLPRLHWKVIDGCKPYFKLRLSPSYLRSGYIKIFLKKWFLSRLMSKNRFLPLELPFFFPVTASKPKHP
jgi:hypothetical protein